MYEVNLSASDDTADTLIKERSFAYTENQRHLYYLLDGYGNLSYQQFYITDVDHTAPTAEFTVLKVPQARYCNQHRQHRTERRRNR